MATQAKITSLEALELLRSRLIVFGTKARRCLGDVGDDVHRMRQWLQQEQRLRWESEIRQRTKKLEQAEQELMSARFTGHQEAILARQRRVNQMKEAVAEAQTKLKVVKKWTVNYDGIADPIFKRLDDLRHYLEFDLPQATAYLVNIQKTLESYTNSPASASSGAPAAAPEPQAVSNKSEQAV